MKITKALPTLVHKTIAHLVLKEGDGPRAQLFLIFTDGTYYEFHSQSRIEGTSGLQAGGLPAVLDYGSPGMKVIFPL